MKVRYQNAVNQITRRFNMGYIMVRPNPFIKNAHATTDRETGHLLIEYNPPFMARLESYSKWAVLMVLAHEVAHHYNLDLYGRFRGGYNSNQKQEINADRFAGFVLRCHGANWDQATDVFEAIDFHRSDKHPDEASRVNALWKGWNEAECKINPPRRVVRSNNNDDLGKALIGLGLGVLAIFGIAALASND